MARRALKNRADWVIAGLAFLALFAFGVPFPLVIIAAAAYGFWRGSGVAEEHAGALPSWRALCRHGVALGGDLARAAGRTGAACWGPITC